MCYTDEISNTSINGCPGAPSNLSSNNDITENFSVWPTSINLFTSGKVSSTVASLFDIQWRSFRLSRQPSGYYGPIGNPFSEGYYRQVSQLILEDDIRAVEGLIVDTKIGRVGFRNHTVPVDAPDGAKWTEYILFIEPEAHCVNTNLTLDYFYRANETGLGEFANWALVDHGGFVNLPYVKPIVHPSNFQTDPAFRDRAFRAAWSHNMLLMQYLNVTTNGSDGIAPFAYMNSKVGKSFPLSLWSGSSLGTVTMQTDANFGQLIYNNSLSISPNPANITADDGFNIGSEACHYPSLFTRSNMSFVAVACGLVYGPPQRTDGGNSLFIDSNSKWSIPLYSCAAGPKAVIREVGFEFNGTGGLESLIIESINERKYLDSSEIPVWGVERTQNDTLYNVQPLWGIVSSELGTRDDISLVHQDHLWLPGYPDPSVVEPVTGKSEPNMPGNLFYTRALQDIFRIGTSLSDTLSAYSGDLDLALYARWLELSNSPEGIAKSLNLIWTDLAANAVIGTRGWHSGSRPSLNWNGLPQGDETISTPSVPVILWTRRIQYHLPYAIPAFIILAVLVLLGALALFFLIFRRTGLAKLRQSLAITSPGRILGLSQGLDRESGESNLAPTELWIRKIGVQRVNLLEMMKGGPSVPLQPVITQSSELLSEQSDTE
jgi:hypothetical protein